MLANNYCSLHSHLQQTGMSNGLRDATSLPARHLTRFGHGQTVRRPNIPTDSSPPERKRKPPSLLVTRAVRADTRQPHAREPGRTGSGSRRIRGFRCPSRRRREPQGPVGRRVDALVTILPADSVSRMRVAMHYLLDHATSSSPLSRLSLGEHMISRRKGHIAPFLDLPSA